MRRVGQMDRVITIQRLTASAVSLLWCARRNVGRSCNAAGKEACRGRDR